MTASPSPGMPSELFAESARNSGDLPSEEMIARAICADDFDFDETVYDTLSPRQQSQFLANARAILALIRPAFEAKEREIERLTNNRDMWKGQCDRQAETIRQLRRSYDLKCSDLEAAEAKLREANMQALSDEGQMREVQAKLARAVEALGPFASYMNDGGDIDAHGNPLPDESGVGWVYLTMGDFRRARAASNIGQNEGATLATSKDTP